MDEKELALQYIQVTGGSLNSHGRCCCRRWTRSAATPGPVKCAAIKIKTCAPKSSASDIWMAKTQS